MRIGASGYTASGLTYLAFRNPDGSKAFVALNRSAGEQTVAVMRIMDEIRRQNGLRFPFEKQSAR